MSSSIRRAKNYIRECDLPSKSINNSQESHGENENSGRTTKNGKPTASDLEEAQLLIGAAGSIGEEQIVFMMDGADVNQEETTVEDGGEGKPEISDEDLQRELQELLDSQLNPEDEADSASKHLMGRREQVFETDDDNRNEDEVEPTKCFTSSEIQAFMNNQIRKQHQQYVHGDQFDKVSNRNLQQPQQHLILVTQNGDKIILIQNPNEMDRDESEQSDFQPCFDITEEEEQQIQSNHKERHRMLLALLDKLREQHKQRLPPAVTTPAVPHLQPIKLVPYTKTKTETNSTGSAVDTDSVSLNDSIAPKPRSKVAKNCRKRLGGPPKWLKPVNTYLNMAVKYMKRREEKVDEISRMFPSASTSFEQKCLNMKQEFLNIELTIERFQNTIGKELEDVSTKFKSFLREIDLENYLDEVEAGDEIDEFDSNMFEVEELEPKTKQKRMSRKTIIASTDIAMKLITPSNISITSTPSEPMSSSLPTHAMEQEEADPFDFNQDPDSNIDIKPIIPNSPAIKTGLVSKQELLNSNHDRPVRSARLHNKRIAKDPITISPPKSKKSMRR